jgi:hypothetical protein
MRALNIADYFTKDLSNDDYKRIRKFVMPDRSNRTLTTLTSKNSAPLQSFSEYQEEKKIFIYDDIDDTHMIKSLRYQLPSENLADF